MPSPSSTTPWISHPAVDVGLISFGWLPLLAAFALANGSSDVEGWWQVLLVVVLVFNFLHRHITFPLVYGDPEVFEQRRRSYLLLPIVFAATTAFCVSWVEPPRVAGQPMAESIDIRDGGRVVVGFRRDGKRDKPVFVALGNARTPEQVVAAFEAELKGRLVVELEERRLHLELPEGRDGAFMIAPNKDEDVLRAVGLHEVDTRWNRRSRPLFTLLAALSAIWTVYHTLMQKYGLLRIYSRKSGTGAWRGDALLVFSGFGAVVTGMLASPSVREMAAENFVEWKVIFSVTAPILAAMPFVFFVALLLALGLSARVFVVGGRPSVPKLAYLLSLLGLYLSFFWDPVAGYLLFGFSHSVEYLAFVNVFSGRKYRERQPTSSAMARAISVQPLAVGLFLVGGAAIYLLWDGQSGMTLKWYVVGSSFLHFLYDGWIWKVRKTAVARPLGIDGPPGPGPASGRHLAGVQHPPSMELQ